MSSSCEVNIICTCSLNLHLNLLMLFALSPLLKIATGFLDYAITLPMWLC